MSPSDALPTRPVHLAVWAAVLVLVVVVDVLPLTSAILVRRAGLHLRRGWLRCHRRALLVRLSLLRLERRARVAGLRARLGLLDLGVRITRSARRWRGVDHAPRGSVP